MGTDLAGLRLHALPFPTLAPNTCLEVPRQQDARVCSLLACFLPGATRKCVYFRLCVQGGKWLSLHLSRESVWLSALRSRKNMDPDEGAAASPGRSAGLPVSLKGGHPSANPSRLQPAVPSQLRLVQAGFAHSAEGTELGTRQQQVMKQVHLHLPPGTSSLRLKTMSTEGCSWRC